LLKNPISRAVALAGACFLAIIPFFWGGSPSGHDFEFHMLSWMEVLGQWKLGILYPRWAAMAHWGYGEARFLFYPPASWTLGAALGALLPWKIVPGAYCWIVLTLAGAAMYRLARQWLPASDALFAGIIYALNPYHLLIVYWRSAYAELLASVLLPLLLLCLVRLFATQSDPSLRPTLWLSLVLAAAWLTNIPAAVMVHYSTVGLALVFVATCAASRGKIETGPERSLPQQSSERQSAPQNWRFLLRIGMRILAAVLLGAGLASFYLLPAIYEQHWIDVGQVLAAGVRPQDNFLFTTIPDPDHNRFNFAVSTLACAQIGVLLLAIWISRLWRSNREIEAATPALIAVTADRIPWILLAAWGVGSTLLMLSLTNPLWQHLPELRFVQLPFRWLLCLNVALALLLAMAAQRRTSRTLIFATLLGAWFSRAVLFAALLSAVIFADYRIQPPWWDAAADIRELRDSVADGTGYEGTDEYVPAGDDAYELNKTLPRITNDTGAPVPATMITWAPTEKHFTVHTDAPEDLTVRLFSYPAWQVLVNGEPIQTQKTEVTGLLVIPIAPGDSDVRIRFRRTMDRAIGNVVSLFSLAIFIILWRKMSPRRSLLSPVDLRVPRD
jgi:hypothetical protein